MTKSQSLRIKMPLGDTYKRKLGKYKIISVNQKDRDVKNLYFDTKSLW